MDRWHMAQITPQLTLTPSHAHCRAMQASPPIYVVGQPSKKFINFKEGMLNGPRGDLITIPLVHNKWTAKPDTTWMTPTTIFHDKVLTTALVERPTFWRAMDLLASTRHTTPSEDKLLQKHQWLGPTTTGVLLASPEELASYCEGLHLDMLKPTVASLRALPSCPVVAPFPDHIPPCTIPADQLKGKYSLSATQTQLVAKGTKVHSQLAALLKWRKEGALGSITSARKVGDATVDILERSVDEYLGFCYKHLALEPALDLVMVPSHVAQFVAFQQARGNEPGTILRQAQQLSTVVTFVGSGRCPRAKAWGHSHQLLVKDWLSSLKAQERALAHPPGQEVVDPRLLAGLWDHLEGSWRGVVQSLQVGTHACPFPCMLTHVSTPCQPIPTLCTHASQAPGQPSKEVCQQIMSLGLGILLGGPHQPPFREGALRPMHTYGHVEGVPCVECG